MQQILLQLLVAKVELVNQHFAVNLSRCNESIREKKLVYLDADIYGPSIPRMMGISKKPIMLVKIKNLIPLESYGIKLYVYWLSCQ